MPDFDWVKARAECCPEKCFAHLQMVLERDADSMNTASQATARKTVCEVKKVGDNVAVTVSSDDSGMRIVYFKLVKFEIRVTTPNGELIFVARPTLNRQGECRFMVDNEEMEMWQVSRRALEDVFFG